MAFSQEAFTVRVFPAYASVDNNRKRNIFFIGSLLGSGGRDSNSTALCLLPQADYYISTLQMTSRGFDRRCTLQVMTSREQEAIDSLAPDQWEIFKAKIKAECE